MNQAQQINEALGNQVDERSKGQFSLTLTVGFEQAEWDAWKKGKSPKGGKFMVVGTPMAAVFAKPLPGGSKGLAVEFSVSMGNDPGKAAKNAKFLQQAADSIGGTE